MQLLFCVCIVCIHCEFSLGPCPSEQLNTKDSDIGLGTLSCFLFKFLWHHYRSFIEMKHRNQNHCWHFLGVNFLNVSFVKWSQKSLQSWWKRCFFVKKLFLHIQVCGCSGCQVKGIRRVFKKKTVQSQRQAQWSGPLQSQTCLPGHFPDEVAPFHQLSRPFSLDLCHVASVKLPLSKSQDYSPRWMYINKNIAVHVCLVSLL